MVGGFFVVGAGATGAVAGRTGGAAPMGRVRGAVELAPATPTAEAPGGALAPEGDAPMSVADGVWTPFWTLPTKPSESGPTR